MTRKKVNNENRAVLDQENPRQNRSLFIGKNELCELKNRLTMFL